MRYCISLAFFLVIAQLFGQNEIVNVRKTLPKTDSLSTWEARSLPGKLDFFADSAFLPENFILQELAKSFSHHIMRSSTLDTICDFASHRWRSSSLGSKSRAPAIRKKCRQIFYGGNCAFGLVTTYAFTLPLVKVKSKYFYDANGEGGFNLYKGRRADLEKDEDPIPLDLFTSEEAVKLMTRTLRRRGFNKQLKDKNIAAFGMAVIPDGGTFFKRRIPTIKIVIMLGSKRMVKS